jgi:hypothetical protein
MKTPLRNVRVTMIGFIGNIIELSEPGISQDIPDGQRVVKALRHRPAYIQLDRHIGEDQKVLLVSKEDIDRGRRNIGLFGDLGNGTAANPMA